MAKRESWSSVTSGGRKTDLFGNRVPLLLVSPSRRRRARSGQRLLVQSIELQGELRSLAQHEDQRMGERMVQMLPLASELLEAAIAGMRDLDGRVPAGSPGHMGESDVRALSELDLSPVLKRFGVAADPLSPRVIHDRNHALDDPRPGSGPSTAEICAALDAMRVQINDLAEADPDMLPVAAVARMLMIAAELARAVAVGLLVAAASAASAGADVVSALLPAAVAAVVSSLCDQLGKALRPAAATLTPSERLKSENDELVLMLNDLAGFADRHGTSTDRSWNAALIRGTATVAVIASIHAKNVARNLSWTSAGAYVEVLEGIRQKLIPVTPMAAASDANPGDLADWLRDAAGQLNSQVIPPDLALCRTVPGPPSTSHQAGTDVRGTSRPVPVTANPGRDGHDQTAPPAGHDPDFEGSGAGRPATAVPRSADDPAAAGHESAPAAAITARIANASIRDGATVTPELDNKTADESDQLARIPPKSAAAARSKTLDPGPPNRAPTSEETGRNFAAGHRLTNERDAEPEPAAASRELGKNLPVVD
jgi:hypothetical protein